MTRNAAIWLPAFLAASLALLTAHGAARPSPPAPSPTAPAPPPLHWARFPVRLFVDAPVQSQEMKRALAGMDEWVTASHGKVCYTLAATPADADITVRFEPVRFLSAEDQTVGETTVFYSKATLRKAKIRLADGNEVPEDLQSAAAHEFGHALGIQIHSDNPADLMFPRELLHISPLHDSNLDDPFTDPAHVVTGHDLRMLQACYPGLFGGGTAGIGGTVEE